VIDQVRMLLKYGHEVHLFVSEKFKKSLELDLQDYLELPAKEMLRFHLVRTIPDTKLVDYQSSISWSKEHQYVSVITAEVLRDYFIENKVDIVSLTIGFLPAGIFRMPEGFGFVRYVCRRLLGYTGSIRFPVFSGIGGRCSFMVLLIVLFSRILPIVAVYLINSEHMKIMSW
jgi:general stress protein CsbA